MLMGCHSYLFIIFLMNQFFIVDLEKIFLPLSSLLPHYYQSHLIVYSSELLSQGGRKVTT